MLEYVLSKQLNSLETLEQQNHGTQEKFRRKTEKEEVRRVSMSVHLDNYVPESVSSMYSQRDMRLYVITVE